MQGHADIIALLNDVLGGELVAINQYFLHAKMCENWGFHRLAKTVRDESIDEMKHAETLTERILFLEGLPNLQKLGKLHIGETVKEQLESDLALEKAAIKRLNDGLELCRKHGDGDDVVAHAVDVGEDVGIPEAEDGPAQRLESGRPRTVGFRRL